MQPLREEEAYPAQPQDAYGWEKLVTERLCLHYGEEDYGMDTRIVRFHNIFGPLGTWDGGREKAPAAMCRKVATAKLTGTREIEIWGDGEQTRSFCYIDDCVAGIRRLMESDYTRAAQPRSGSADQHQRAGRPGGGMPPASTSTSSTCQAPRASAAATRTTRRLAPGARLGAADLARGRHRTDLRAGSRRRWRSRRNRRAGGRPRMLSSLTRSDRCRASTCSASASARSTWTTRSR